MSTLVDRVRDKYAAVADSSLSNEHAGVRAVAEAFGYRAAELASIPAEANMGLSCGNPTAFASLKPGEVVVDLGCGGGLDVFLAAPKVGPTGKAIGIDMTPEMIELARRERGQGRQRQPLTNVEFHLATIDQLPLPDASVDCVISNCVINLAPDKRRGLPRDRPACSSRAAGWPSATSPSRSRCPPRSGRDVLAYVGCIAGAIRIDDYQPTACAKRVSPHVQVIDTGADLNAYAKVENQSGCCSPAMGEAACCGPAAKTLDLSEEEKIAASGGCCTGASVEPDVHTGLAELIAKYDVNDYAASVQIYAVKP